MGKKISNCVICSKVLEERDTMYKRIGVCSKVCHLERKKLLLLKRAEKYDPIFCDTCGKQFKPTQKKQKRCSIECVKIFHKNNYKNSKTDFNLFKRDNFKCIYCGKSSIEDNVKLTIEHITPLVLNGKTHLDNLITACSECNKSKNGSELSLEIKQRIYNVLLSRNNNLSIIEISKIEKEIQGLQASHFYRVNKMQKRGDNG